MADNTHSFFFNFKILIIFREEGNKGEREEEQH